MKLIVSESIKYITVLSVMSLLLACTGGDQGEEGLPSNPVDPTLSKINISVINSNNFTVSEGSENVFNFQLSEATSEITRITWSITSTLGDGNASQDFSITSGIISIPANSTSFDYILPVSDDLIYEGQETFNWTFIDVSEHAKAETNQILFTVEDDETPPVVNFAQSTGSYNEADGSVSVNLNLDKEATKDVSLTFSVSGSALNGSDYINLTGSPLVIPAGFKVGIISFQIQDDVEVEANESVIITLNSATLGSNQSLNLGAKSVNTSTIIENDASLTTIINQAVSQIDPAKTYPISYLLQFSRPINTSSFDTNDITNGGTANVSSWTISNSGNDRDFTLTANGTLNVGTIIPSINANQVQDPLGVNNEASTATDNMVSFAPEIEFVLSADNVAENQASGAKNLNVSLSAPLSFSLSVSYSVTGGTALGTGVDYTLADGVLNFSPGELLKSIPVSLVDDNFYEGNETIEITLFNPTGGSILGAKTLHTLTLLENDPQAVIEFSTLNQTINEITGATLVTLTKSAESETNISVPFSLSGSAGTTDHDLVAGTILFNPNDLSKTLSFNILDDANYDAGETLILTLGTPTSGVLGSNSTHTITITEPILPQSVMCGLLSSDSAFGRIFDSGSNSSNYTNGENCGFLIQPVGASYVELKKVSFFTFDISDWLEVYEGIDDTGTLIGRYHTSNFPSFVRSNLGSMYLKWSSDVINSSNGFELRWQSDGGLSLSLSQSTIQISETLSMSAFGGKAPYTFSLFSGSGSVSGSTFTPSAPGNAILRVTDSLLNTADKEVLVVDNTTLTGVSICGPLSSQDPSGRLFDSGGPWEYYSNSEDCTFLIQPSGATSVQLSPTYFNTRNQNDWLEVYDGTDSNGTLLGRFANTDFISPVTASSGSLFIKWHSDGNYNDPGFDLSWTSNAPVTLAVSESSVALGQTINLAALGGVGPYVYSIVSGSGSLSGAQFIASTTQAGSVILRVTDSLSQTNDKVISVVDNTTIQGLNMCSVVSASASSGRLFDSGGPYEYYSNSEDCTFLIQPTGASQIQISSNYFNLRNQADWLEIYDGTSEAGTLLGRFTNTDFQAPVTATSGAMYLKWHSDENYNDPGFDLTWSSNAPVSLAVSESTIPINGTLTFGAVGGQAPYTYSLPNGLGSITDNVFTASSEPGVVTLRVTDNLSQSFDKKIQVIDVNTIQGVSMCSVQQSFEPTGRIFDSGGLYGYYSNNEDCSMLIQPAGATQIHLSSNYFNLRNQADWLKIYEGTDDTGTLLGHFTNTDFQAPITANASSVFIKWHSDSIYNDPGFDLMWSSNAPLKLAASRFTVEAGSTISLSPLGGVAPYVYSKVSGEGSFLGSQFTSSLSDPGPVVLRVTDSLSNTFILKSIFL